MIGLLGKKIGMTQVFTADNELVPVTAIEAGPCPVLAIKDKSVQVAFDVVSTKHMKRPQAGYFTKLNTDPCKIIKEFLKEPGKEYKVGEEFKVDLFKAGDFVDISGVSKGKGFQGGMKRWGWHGGPKTHGSTSHRRIGSLGSSTSPGRTWKGHHLPGHMGACRVTVQNIKVVKVDPENNLLLVKGAVPGYKNNYLVIRKSKKKTLQAQTKKIQPQRKAETKKK
jgi:large subunit ribosomal protein L3